VTIVVLPCPFSPDDTEADWPPNVKPRRQAELAGVLACRRPAQLSWSDLVTDGLDRWFDGEYPTTTFRDDVMDDPTIAEIERWLRECARAPEREEAEGGAADSADTAADQSRPFWPYLESDDFWRE
jgi:hypothetical protein